MFNLLMFLMILQPYEACKNSVRIYTLYDDRGFFIKVHKYMTISIL